MARQARFGEDRAQAHAHTAAKAAQPVKTSELHTAPDRRDRFAGLPSKVWLEESLLRTWVVADPDIILALLRSPHAVILSVDDMIDAIERAYGADFPNVRFAARHLPLFLEGDIHAEHRRRFSAYLAGRWAELETRLPELVEHHLRPLRNSGPVELVSQVTGPLTRDINAIFIGCPLPQEIAALELLDLFALNKSLARFKDLDLRVGRAIDFLSSQDTGKESLAYRFTALAMGFETLMTMLTEGLHSAFRDQPAEAGSHARLPEFPIETGVPISYRKAAGDFVMAEHDFKAGDLLRLQLQTLGYSVRDADRRSLFGAGTHSCVGKHISLRLWAELRREFDAMAVRGQVKSYEVAASHYLLRHNSVHIEVV